MPLIVLTADRPPELREVGAGQAIDQIKLYGTAAKWFVEVGTHDPSRETADPPPRARLPRLLDRRGRPPRPRAPELPAARAARARSREELDPADWAGRARRRPVDRGARARERPPLRRRPRRRRADRRRAARADRVRPRSRGRRGRRVPAGGRGGLAAARRADLGRQVRRPRPLPRDRALRRAAPGRGVRGAERAGPRSAGRRHAHVEAASRASSRSRHRSWSIRMARGTNPRGPRSSSCTRRPSRPWMLWPAAVEMRVAGSADDGWLDGVAGAAIGWWRRRSRPSPDDFEGKILASLEPELPDEAVVWVSSSMPIRDVEACFPQSPKRHPLPREPRRERHRRRRLVGARRRDRHAASRPGC